MKTNYVLCAAAAAALAVAGCSQNSSKKTQLTTELQASDTAGYPIPTAYEVTDLINRSGAAYIFDVTNPTSKVDAYLSESEKALNLGVYGADLAYATTYNQTQETMSYLKALKQLVDELQVVTNLNAQLAQRVEEHINENNKDSLIHIITCSFHETYSFLVDNGKDNTSILVMSGMWVEALYLLAYVTTTSANPEDLMPVVAAQKQPLDKLMAIIEKNTSSDDIAQLQTQLQPIVDEFATVGKDITFAQAKQIFSVAEKVRAGIIK
ncbi:MAG: hypothetical protein LBS94_01690 [Prevotellaceae bacterium]|jgi:hypothetical protein|nr:hypothetical protein [Prevotellaceae bacterium]